MFELLTSRSAFAGSSLQGLAVLSALLLSACAGLQPPPQQPDPVIAELKIRARNLAAAGQPRRSLQTYQAIHALAPLETSVIEPMRALQQSLQEQSRAHREQGHRLLARGKPEQARMAFLKSLACVPDRNDALADLQDLTRSQGTILSTPSTERADPRRIAQDVYQDPDKDFIVAHFLDPDRSSSPLRVKLPRLDFELKREPRQQPARKKPSKHLSIRDLKEGSPARSAQSVASGGQGTAQDPAQTYHKAMRLKNRGDHASALRVLSSLPSEFKDVREQRSELRRTLKTRAEARYKAGLASFLADDLKQAIREWERALALDPGHRKARKGLDKARVLLKTLENY
jgi:tetratricopeptide (TPR) repeat protein